MQLVFSRTPFEIWQFKDGEKIKEVTQLGLVSWILEKYKDELEQMPNEKLKEIAESYGKECPKRWKFYQAMNSRPRPKREEKKLELVGPVERPKVHEIKKRSCLQCQKEMQSHHVGERICQVCRKKKDYHQQDSATYALAEYR